MHVSRALIFQGGPAAKLLALAPKSLPHGGLGARLGGHDVGMSRTSCLQPALWILVRITGGKAGADDHLRGPGANHICKVEHY